jgi:hypothetical protein
LTECNIRHRGVRRRIRSHYPTSVNRARIFPAARSPSPRPHDRAPSIPARCRRHTACGVGSGRHEGASPRSSRGRLLKSSRASTPQDGVERSAQGMWPRLCRMTRPATPVSRQTTPLGPPWPVCCQRRQRRMRLCGESNLRFGRFRVVPSTATVAERSLACAARSWSFRYRIRPQAPLPPTGGSASSLGSSRSQLGVGDTS